MTIRIPPSLKWLVVKRATIAGRIKLQINNFEASKSKFDLEQKKLIAKHEQTISHLKRDLAAIDRSIRMHEILINPKLIEATRVQSKPCTTSYGSISRAIYGALALAAPKAITTADITSYVIAKCGFDNSAEKYQYMRIKVQHRLKDLAKLGKVGRLHSLSGGEHGVWCDVSSIESLQLQQFQTSAYFLGSSHQTSVKSLPSLPIQEVS